MKRRHLDWLAANGVKFDHDALSVVVTAGSYSVRTRKQLRKDDIVAVIPKKATLGPITGALRRVHLDAGRGLWPPKQLLQDDFLLPSVVYFELLRGKQSQWFSYLDTINAPPILSLWPESAWGLLDGTDLEGTCSEGLQHCLSYFENNLSPYLRALSRESAAKEDALGRGWRVSQANIGLFLHAVALSKSRGFFIDEIHGEALCPFADLLNHKPSKRETAATFEEEGEPIPPQLAHVIRLPLMEAAIGSAPDDEENLVLIILDDVSPNAELWNFYGENSNATLLHDYGFVVNENAYDCIHVSLQHFVDAAEDLSRRDVRRRLEILDKMGGFQELFQLHVSSTIDIHDDMLCVLYLLVAPDNLVVRDDGDLMLLQLDILEQNGGYENLLAAAVDYKNSQTGRQALSTLLAKALKNRRENIAAGEVAERNQLQSTNDAQTNECIRLARAYRSCERAVLDCVMGCI